MYRCVGANASDTGPSTQQTTMAATCRVLRSRYKCLPARRCRADIATKRCRPVFGVRPPDGDSHAKLHVQDHCGACAPGASCRFHRQYAVVEISGREFERLPNVLGLKFEVRHPVRGEGGEEAREAALLEGHRWMP